MSDCIFCKIISKKIPCHKIYEDDYVLAFLDIFPHTKGHTVVVPKKHYSKLSELSQEESINFFIGLNKSIDRIQEVLKPEGMNIGTNDGATAGQVVPHIHWHIFPRWIGDNGGSFHSIIKSKEKIDVDEVAKLFK